MSPRPRHASLSARGTLKISAPVWMANGAFASIIATYTAAHPQVIFDIDLSARMVNLVDEGFDLALRVSTALDPGMIARPLADVEFQLFGAPSYLTRAPLTSLASLNGHALLAYTALPASGILTLAGPDGIEKVSMRPILWCGNELMLREAALAGMGLVFLPYWLAQDHVTAGRLEPVLPGAAVMTAKLYGVYPSRKYLSAKVQTFLDHLAAFARAGDLLSPKQPAAEGKAAHVSTGESRLIDIALP